MVFLSNAQNIHKSISVDISDFPLEEVLDTISVLSGYNFSYNSMIMPAGSLFELKADDEPVISILDRLLIGTSITYSIDKEQIVLRKEVVKEKKLKNEYFSISGRVIDFETKEFISEVNVYLDETSIGSVTNENGYFKIEKIPFGSYMLVFSHLSYEHKVFEIIKNTSSNTHINTELKLTYSELAPVEVIANPIRLTGEYAEYTTIFNDQFLGQSANSIQCKILNQEVISYSFDNNTNTLTATASEPLIVNNSALGYLLFCDLKDLVYTNDNVQYVGRVRFEELTPADEKEMNKWMKNRKESYLGSLRHFFKSVIEGKHRQKGYMAFYIDDISNVNNKELRESKLDTFLIPTDIPQLYEIRLNKKLYVIYNKELETSEYLIQMEKDILKNITFNTNNMLFLNRKPDVQKSLIEVNLDKIMVDINGNLVNPTGLSVSGYWSWERMADLVPINFDLKK